MVSWVIRASVAMLLLGAAGTASADVCITIDETRDTLAPRDRTGALLLVTTQFEAEGERVVAPGCARPFVLVHNPLDVLTVVTVSGDGKTWQATARSADDLPAIYSQIVRSIVTGRPMTGLNVIDRTNVTASQAEAKRIHSDSLWYGRIGYGSIFAGHAYGTAAFGFGYRAELDSFAIDLSFLNHQFPSSGSDSSARAAALSVLKVSGLRFVHPQTNRSAYYGAGLSYGFRSVSRGSYYSTPAGYTTNASGSGLQAELTAGYEVARATSLRVFVQADAVLPFYPITSETRAFNGAVTRDSQYAPSLVLSLGVGAQKR